MINKVFIVYDTLFQVIHGVYSNKISAKTAIGDNPWLYLSKHKVRKK